MDIEVIIYLVFLAVALLGRLLGKKKPQQPASSQKSKPARPAKSFEELLEEFTMGESEPEISETRPANPSTPERRSAPRESVESSFAPPQDDFQFESQDKLKTLDEMVDINNLRTTSKLAPVEEIEEEVEETDLHELLKDPEEARKAIILSEILNRKYS